MQLAEVRKAQRSNDRQNQRNEGAAMRAAGAGTATVGLIGGGVPGVREPDGLKTFLVRGKTKQQRAADPGLKDEKSPAHPKNLRHNARQLRSQPRAGILGFRANVHDGYVRTQHALPPTRDRAELGRRAGVLEAEKSITRGMRIARRATYPLTIGGTGLAVAGHRKMKDEPAKVGKRDRFEEASATALGAGASAAAAGTAVPAGLRHFSRKSTNKAKHHTLEAQKLHPPAGGLKTIPAQHDPTFGTVIKPAKQTSAPEVSTKDIDYRSASDKVRYEVGRHRGIATKERYFSAVMDKTGRQFKHLRGPGLAVAGAGGAGLLGSRGKKAAEERFGKSFTGAGWKPASTLSAAERKAVRGRRGGRGAVESRGVPSSSNPNNVALTQVRRLNEQATPSSRRNVSFGPGVGRDTQERVLSGLPKKVRRPVTVQDATPHFPATTNIAFGRAGSRRPATVFAQRDISPGTARHEFEHSQPRRNYGRLANVQADPRRTMREEGRADALVARAGKAGAKADTDYEAHSALSAAERRGNRVAGAALNQVGVDRSKIAEYDRIRTKLKAPARGLEVLPDSPLVGQIRAGEPRKKRGLFGKSVTYGYQERRRNKARTVQQVGGAALVAGGASHLQVGPAVARGQRFAETRGRGRQYRQGADVVRRGRNEVRRTSGQAVDVLRGRVPGLGTALNIIPAKLRPHAAIGGGALLAARGTPAHDVRFVPTGRF